MQKLLLILIIIISSPALLLAANDRDVRFTVHNLSNNTDPALGTVYNTGDDTRNQGASDMAQVCIFCHTPHNAGVNVPLWNKAFNPANAAAYQLYTSSATLSNAAKGSKILPNSESMLCLSCHDGKTAINVVHSVQAGPGVGASLSGDPMIQFGMAMEEIYLAEPTGNRNAMNIGAIRDANGDVIAGPASGNNLTDDHPVGFSYADAQAESSAGLHAIDVAKANGVRFYGPKRDRMECSSCHDPHVFYGSGRSAALPKAIPDGNPGSFSTATDDQKNRAPFLVRSNVGSGLCLSCHKK